MSSTSLHLPKELLERLNRRAKALRTSRNRVIVDALERGLNDSDEWSPEFLEALAELTPSEKTLDDARELSEQAVSSRTRKAAPF